MKNTRKTSNNKKIFVIISILAVLLIATGTVYALNSPLFKGDTTSNGPTEEEKQQQQQTEADAKQDFVDATKDQEVPGVTPEIPSSANSIRLSASQDAGMVTVTSKLEGFSAGTCKLEITNGASSISENADIIYQPEYSTCAGFSIVKTRLGAGTWNIVLKVTPAGGSELSQTLTYAVQ